MSPNWCNDTLYIKGDKGQIALFKEIIREYNELQELGDPEEPPRPFSIDIFYPMPEKVGEDWYAWRCAHWGTKWDVSVPELLEESETTLKYRFDTAWSPPCAAIVTISQQFPKLTFEIEYSEPGMCFEGTFVARNGVVIKNNEHEMKERDSDDK